MEGRPLFVDVFGAGPPTTLVIGGIHGDEPSGIEIARRLPVITLELPKGRPIAECWQQNRQALLEAIAAEGQTPVSPAQPSR